MAESRKVFETVEAARLDLGEERSRPSWRQSSHTLPFGELSPDEFEILCFLLLKAEHPNDRIVYYGKSGDLGRDIIHERPDGSRLLIQCKRYTNNVDAGVIRSELAKLVVNVFTQRIVDAPAEMAFYVVPDLTSPAIDLLNDQSSWRTKAVGELRLHLNKEPSEELIAFACSWWPSFVHEQAISLTARCKCHHQLLQEFFDVRMVIDATRAEIQEDFRREGDRIISSVGSIVGRRACDLVAPEPVGWEEITAAFTAASQPLLTWPTTLGNDEWIERPELGSLQEAIASENTSTTVLLGPPGSGKSALLSRLGQQLMAKGYVVLAVKADFIDRHVDTEAKLSEFLRLPALLSHCVKEASESGTTVVLLDQLDALADLLDLQSGRLNALLDVIHTLNGGPGVHLVASCRDFEFNHDVRLAGISAQPVKMQLPTWERIADLLKKDHGIDASNWPDVFRESLRKPQHLKVFLSYLQGSSEYDVSRSYQQLLDDLWEQRVTNPDGLSGRSELLIEMATVMAEQEILWLPVARFEGRQRLVVALEAADILHRPSGKSTIGFRHQTLFEHARARAFAKGSARLAPYVLNKRQNALFVRPTIWATLRYLRAASPAQYSQELGDLLRATLRPHVTQLLIEFLGSVEDPTDEEQQYLQRWLDDSGYRVRTLLAIVGNDGWFKRLKDTHFPTYMQLPHDEVWPMVRVLKSAWAFADEDCLALVERYWLPNTDRDAVTLNLFQDRAQWDPRTVGHVCSIIDRTDVGEMYVMDVAEVVSEHAPELAPRIIATKLKRELRLLEAASAPAPDPMEESDTPLVRQMYNGESRRKRDYERLLSCSNGFYELSAIAEAAPDAFLGEVWPWFIDVLEHLLQPPHHIIYSFRECYCLALDLDEKHMASDYIVLSLDDAVKELAKTRPDDFRQFAETWKGYDAMPVQRFLCRGLLEAAERIPEQALEFLTSDRRRLALGGHRDSLGDSQALIRAASAHLTADQLRQLEQAVINWSEYVENIADEDAGTRFLRRKWDREKRLRLLKALPFDRLSPETQQLIQAEEIALPDYRDYDHDFGRMAVVGSPMSAEQMKEAKDEHVLNLFDELVDSTGAHHPRDFMRGGVEQASQELARLAETEPHRVASLLRRFRAADQQKPVAYAIRALGDNSDYATEELFGLIRELDHSGFQSEDFRGEAGQACLTRANKEDGLPDDMLVLLEGWLGDWKEFSYFRDEENDEKDDEKQRPLLWGYRGGVVLPHGTYWIVRALTYGHLRKLPPEYDKWLGILDRHLARPESVYTWKTLTEELRFLGRCDIGRAIAFLSRLFKKYSGVRDSQDGVILVARIRFSVPSEEYRNILEGVRTGNWRLAKQAYGELLGLSYLLEEHLSWVAGDFDTDIDEPQVAMGVAYAAAHLFWEDAESQKRSTDIFVRLAGSAKGEVAIALMSLFATNDALPAHDDSKRLLNAILSNDEMLVAAPEHWFVEKLEDVVVYCPELVCNVCNRFVDAHANQLNNVATSLSLAARNLVNIAMTLQRLPSCRDNGLTLFERLLELGIYDASSLLTRLDCRPVNVPPAVPRRRRRRK